MTMSSGPLSLEDAIEAERERRAKLLADGYEFHYWRHRGDDEPPRDEYWCPDCVGWYGVPHDGSHREPVCRWADGSHFCACIDCHVARTLRESPA